MTEEDRSAATDVLVIGGGGAGLAAAVEAAGLGAKVLVLEKNPKLGGSTGMAIGAFTAPTTSLQRRKGIHDSLDAFREDLNLISPEELDANSHELRELLVLELGRTMEWLQGMGVAFIGPFPEGKHRVPRMHNAVPSGRVFVAALEREARRRGVEIRCSMRVSKLLQDPSGRVCGVRCSGDSGEREFHARRAVILTTGDYSNNQALKREHLEPGLAELQGANPTATGDGHLMAADIGGILVNMHLSQTYTLRFPAPPPGARVWWWESLLVERPVLARAAAALANSAPAWVIRPVLKQALTALMAPELAMFAAGAVLVNREGKRFCNELTNLKDLVVAVARQSEPGAYLLLDAKLARHFSQPSNPISTAPGVGWAYFPDYRKSRPDIVFKGQTWQEVGDRAGIDGTELAATMDEYNCAARGDREDVTGRPPSGVTYSEPPFYALGPVQARHGTTKGSLRVDGSFRVLDHESNAIPGLYAAGYSGLGGLALSGLHGVSIAWAFISGRAAGRSVVANGPPAMEADEQLPD
jgi:fumarate reductase flavoprotein subunit